MDDDRIGDAVRGNSAPASRLKIIVDLLAEGVERRLASSGGQHGDCGSAALELSDQARLDHTSGCEFTQRKPESDHAQ